MLRSGAKTDKGRLRHKNEDAFYVNENKGLLMVADGMGGHKAGEVASRLAIEVIKNVLEAENPDFLNSEMLTEAVKEANKIIYLKSLENTSFYGMGTTAVVALIKGDRLIIAHVGDSRAYLYAKKRLNRLTEDHSYINQLIREGKITEKEARMHPRRGEILRALGIDRTVEVDVQELPYNSDLIMLCTDGLTNMLTDEEIEEILQSKLHFQQACERLVDKANEAGGMDNITVVLAQSN